LQCGQRKSFTLYLHGNGRKQTPQPIFDRGEPFARDLCLCSCLLFTFGACIGVALFDIGRTAIFSRLPPTPIEDFLGSHDLAPKYSAPKKLLALQELLPNTGGKSLKGIASNVLGPGGKPVRLLIVSFDYDTNRAVFFSLRSRRKEGRMGRRATRQCHSCRSCSCIDKRADSLL